MNNNNNSLVSIIIPFFNEEEKIEKCLRSVLNSSYRYFEILLIDDGSTDSSFEICKKMEESDSRIVLFHLENGGVSKARNFGLSKARGEYIWFVDADDEVYEQSLELMVKAIQTNGTDLCIGKYDSKRINDYQSNKEGYIPIEEYIEDICRNDSMYYFVLWNKLFKREKITNNNIKFNEKYFFGEDGIFNLEYLKFVKKVSGINKEIYYYSEGYNDGKEKRTSVERESYIFEVLRDGFSRKRELAEKYNSKVEEILMCHFFGQIKSILRKLICLNNKEYGKLISDIWNSKEFTESIECKKNRGKSVQIARISKRLKIKKIFMLYLRITRNKG